ncbi:MAG TPA: LysM domain-containing protein [Roseiflexaceae bacterium]|nr:LysM domain-containing protein [Roseiflexaceae bacterium]
MTPLVYGVLAVLAIGLGLFVANLFGNPASIPPPPNGVASASVRTATATAGAKATDAPTQTPKATSKPTAATAARTSAPAKTTAATAAAESTSTSAPTSDAPTVPAGEVTALPAATAATTATAQSTATAAYIEYTIQRGDSLKGIAQRYNVTIQQILAMNDIPNPDSLTVGNVIKIPTP